MHARTNVQRQGSAQQGSHQLGSQRRGSSNVAQDKKAPVKTRPPPNKDMPGHSLIMTQVHGKGDSMVEKAQPRRIRRRSGRLGEAHKAARWAAREEAARQARLIERPKVEARPTSQKEAPPVEASHMKEAHHVDINEGNKPEI